MSATPGIGAPVSSVSPNVPSLLVPPSYIPSSPPFGVNTVSSLTLTPSSSAPVATSASSKQYQQTSSALQPTMSVTSPMSVASTATRTSVNSPVPSSTVFSTSAVSSVPSSAQSQVTSSNGNQSTTSASEKSTAQPSTALTTTAPSTTESSTLASSPTTSLFGPTSSSSTSVVPLTSNTPFIVASLPPSSSSSSSSIVNTYPPLTTVSESTTIFIISTNSQGQIVTSVPPVVTEVVTTTGDGGIVTTVTQAVVNPTLAGNDGATGGSSFFANTGAVVGVFVVVGLAGASIMMWLLFATRRRQRMKRIEQDTAVEAAAAVAGLNRAPLDDEDNDGSSTFPSTYRLFSSGTGQRKGFLGLGGSGSLPTSSRLSQILDDTTRNGTTSHPGHSVEHCAGDYPVGYVPARTRSPSPRAERGIDDLGSSRDRKSSYGHTPTYSAGSFEPLLANYVQNMSEHDGSTRVTRRPRNQSSQHLVNDLAPNENTLDGSPEDVSRTSSKRQNSHDSSVRSVLRDEEDYARYILVVRNIPDNQSQRSS